jgi:hypothetical protein
VRRLAAGQSGGANVALYESVGLGDSRMVAEVAAELGIL